MNRTALGTAVVACLSILSVFPAGAGDLQVDGQLISTASTGTPPLAVSSTTRVDNLNASLLDGLDSSDLFTAATDGAGSGLDADLLDGVDASGLARSLGNVVRVGTTGGDFTSIQAALDSITTASAGNPFLVLVGPGVYSERVAMKPFVDIQGAGEGVTKITQSGSTDPDFGTVAGADDAELRFLTVENTGGTDGIVGVYNRDVSPRLLHVTVEVDGSGSFTYGVFNESTTGSPITPELTHVTVRTAGSSGDLAVLNGVDADTRMRHVRVDVRGTGSTLYGVYNDTAAPTLRDVDVTVASPKATGSIFALVNDDIPSADLGSVRVTVSGGSTRYGVYTLTGDLTMLDLEVEVSGDADLSYGVFNEEATVVVDGCSVEVEGGTDGSSLAYGVRNFDASGELRDCDVNVSSGGGTEYALSGFDSTGMGGPFRFDIHSSRLTGDEAALSGSSTFLILAGASMLDGGTQGSATFSCVHAYDGSFVELTTGCATVSP